MGGMIYNQAVAGWNAAVNATTGTVLAVSGSGMSAQITVQSQVTGQNVTFPYGRANTPLVGDVVLYLADETGAPKVGIGCARAALLGTGAPTGIAIDNVNGFAYVTGKGTLTKIQLSTFTVVGTVAIGGASSVALDGTYAYVGTTAARVYRVTLSTFTVYGTYFATGASGSLCMAVDPTETYLVCGATGGAYAYVERITLSSWTGVGLSISTQGPPLTGIAIDNTGTYAYFSGSSFSHVYQYNIAANTVSTLITWSSPLYISTYCALNPADGSLFVCANASNNAVIHHTFSPAANTTVATFSGQAEQIAIDPAGDYAYISVGGAIYQMNLSGYGLSAPLSIGSTVSALAIDAAGTYLYVCDSSDGTVTQVTIPAFAINNAILA